MLYVISSQSMWKSIQGCGEHGVTHTFLLPSKSLQVLSLSALTTLLHPSRTDYATHKIDVEDRELSPSVIAETDSCFSLFLKIQIQL